MKVVLLAGGLGTRLREETEYRPKPMVEIGGRPILWHIMKIYAFYGHTDFTICLGYKGDVIRDYFLNYQVRNCDFTIALDERKIEVHGNHTETGWRVTLIGTGIDTATGGRLRRASHHLKEGTFLATYGDGVADIAIPRLIEVHRRQRKLATVTAVRPGSRFGELAFSGNIATTFQEKPQVREGWINGGFFVFEPEVFELIQGDEDSLEGGLVSKLAAAGELAVYSHDGFWQCMDTYREMELLNDLWRHAQAPWAVWQRPA